MSAIRVRTFLPTASSAANEIPLGPEGRTDGKRSIREIFSFGRVRSECTDTIPVKGKGGLDRGEKAEKHYREGTSSLLCYRLQYNERMEEQMEMAVVVWSETSNWAKMTTKIDGKIGG